MVIQRHLRTHYPYLDHSLIPLTFVQAQKNVVLELLYPGVLLRLLQYYFVGVGLHNIAAVQLPALLVFFLPILRILQFGHIRLSLGLVILFLFVLLGVVGLVLSELGQFDEGESRDNDRADGQEYQAFVHVCDETILIVQL